MKMQNMTRCQLVAKCQNLEKEVQYLKGIIRGIQIGEIKVKQADPVSNLYGYATIGKIIPSNKISPKPISLTRWIRDAIKELSDEHGRAFEFDVVTLVANRYKIFTSLVSSHIGLLIETGDIMEIKKGVLKLVWDD
jgi:hypothetical protein